MRFEALDREHKEQLHSSALKLLEEVGFLVDSTALISRLQDAGFPTAAPDRVLIPRARVEAALEKAPRSVRLGARRKEREINLNGRRTFVTTDGCGAKALDLDTGQIRASTLADVAASARLTDALEQLDVYWSMVSAQDVPATHRVAREFLTTLQNCTKPIQMIDVSDAGEAQLLARMARVLEQEKVIDTAPLSVLISVVSPMRLDPGATEAALVLAGEKVPIIATSMPIASVTSPATAAGTLVLAHAEVLGLVTILQSLHPGCPVIYTSYPSFANPRTGATTYFDPRSDWTSAAATELGRHAGLPCFASGNQMALLSGADLVSYGGMLETSTVLSLQQLVIDNEILQDWRLRMRAQEVSPETLALEVIRTVGPGGHFLAQKHTVRHMKEFFIPRFTGEEGTLASMTAPGESGSAGERAGREARRILDSHQIEPLPPAVERELAHLADQPARKIPA
ncbi:MAG: trimethylamine methyltransferase family protein [Acidobacteriota bacterium]